MLARHYYGPSEGESLEDLQGRLAVAEDEDARLSVALEILKQGHFSVLGELRPLLSSGSREVRRAASRLFADVCTHGAVQYLFEPLDLAEDPWEERTHMLSLGRTLSLGAIPLLLRYYEEREEPDLADYTVTALKTILSLPGLHEYDLSDAARLCRQSAAQLDPHVYHFRGKPVFAGDLTKEVIIAAGGSYKERTEFKLSFEPTLLSNFSGIACPVRYGVRVDDDLFRQLADYTKALARMPWVKGAKYFYGHRVP
jgi:hypothetical protein